MCRHRIQLFAHSRRAQRQSTVHRLHSCTQRSAEHTLTHTRPAALLCVLCPSSSNSSQRGTRAVSATCQRHDPCQGPTGHRVVVCTPRHAHGHRPPRTSTTHTVCIRPTVVMGRKLTHERCMLSSPSHAACKQTRQRLATGFPVEEPNQARVRAPRVRARRPPLAALASTGASRWSVPSACGRRSRSPRPP